VAAGVLKEEEGSDKELEDREDEDENESSESSSEEDELDLTAFDRAKQRIQVIRRGRLADLVKGREGGGTALGGWIEKFLHP